MNEWVVQTYTDIFDDDGVAIKPGQRPFEWRTWSESGKDERMAPKPLEEAIDRAVNFVTQIREKYPHMLKKVDHVRFRLYNINTEEVIPMETFGL